MPMTAAEATRVIATSVAGADYTLTTPTAVGLETTAGTGTAPGTPIPGDPRVQVGGWNAAATAGGVTAGNNADAFSFTNMPAVSSPPVDYFSVYDTAGTPNRKWYGQLAASRVTVSGDTLTFAATALSLGIVTSAQSTPSV